MDHRAEVHGRSAGAQISHGHQRWEREDPRHDQNLRDARKEDVQERAAGAAGGGGGEEDEGIGGLGCKTRYNKWGWTDIRFTGSFYPDRMNANIFGDLSHSVISFSVYFFVLILEKKKLKYKVSHICNSISKHKYDLLSKDKDNGFLYIFYSQNMGVRKKNYSCMMVSVFLLKS